jgi:hypothetical protein
VFDMLRSKFAFRCAYRARSKTNKGGRSGNMGSCKLLNLDADGATKVALKDKLQINLSSGPYMSSIGLLYILCMP